MFLVKCLYNVSLDNCTKLTSIGSSAFSGCSSLTSIKIGATTPPTLGGGAFDYCSALKTICVPSASVGAYQQASGWSDYSGMFLEF